MGHQDCCTLVRPLDNTVNCMYDISKWVSK